MRYKESLEKIAFLTEKAKSFDEDVSQNFSLIPQASVQSIFLLHGIVTTRAHSCNLFSMVKTQLDPQKEDKNQFISAAEQLCGDPSLIPDGILDPDLPGLQSISLSEWRQFQLDDRIVGSVFRKLEQKGELKAANSDNHEFKVFVRETTYTSHHVPHKTEAASREVVPSIGSAF